MTRAAIFSAVGFEPGTVAPTAWHSFDSLLQLFRFHWRLLPEDEARDAVRSLVGIIRERPDERLNGGFGGPHGTVPFSSYRPSLLFALLGPLKRLDSELANAVIGENRELRRAAEIYPSGPDTEFDRPVEQLSRRSPGAVEKRLDRLCTRLAILPHRG